MPRKSSAKSDAGRLEVSVSVRHPRLRGAESAAPALRVLDEHKEEFELRDSVFGAEAFKALAKHGQATKRLKRSATELSLVFVTDEELADLHDRFLDDPTPTDVITFPAEPGFGQAGEICVSVDAARRQPGRKFSDELALYVIHGWLHLAGHDDLQPAKKRRMRRAEHKALALLRAAKAMPQFTLSRPLG